MAETSRGSVPSAAHYERSMGRWSRLIAAEFLRTFAAEPDLRWLDVGCGTGVLTHAIADSCTPRQLVGVDPEPVFIRFAADRREDDDALFVVGSAQNLPLADAQFDCVVSGLVLNFLPDAAAGLAEMRRVAARGARVAAYVWDYAEGMQPMRLFWDAATTFDPAAAELDQGRRPLSNANALEALFVQAGFGVVTVAALETSARFAGFDEFWLPFTEGGRFPAFAYYAGRSPSQREAIRAHVLARLPLNSDGSFALGLRAWVAQGRIEVAD